MNTLRSSNTLNKLLYYFNRIRFELRGKVIHLTPKGKVCGVVLVSGDTLPYLDRRFAIADARAGRQRNVLITNEFLRRGYAVDIIKFTDERFVPRKHYAYFVDMGMNVERLKPLLGDDCITVFNIRTTYWKFNNEAEQKRLTDIENRRGITLPASRGLPPSRAIELCDYAFSNGNAFTASTYAYAHKPISLIPAATSHTYTNPEQKDFDSIRGNFVWFGGAGLAHKGLDLVLEAFEHMPEYTLTVCGKISSSDPFVQAYNKELYETKNITTISWIDPGSEQFKHICAQSLGMVFSSCAEGGCGSVIVSMHAGLIPIISRESGIDVKDFGIQLKENSVQEIQSAVRHLSSLPTDDLRARAQKTWQYAHTYHTTESWVKGFSSFVDVLEQHRSKVNHE